MGGMKMKKRILSLVLAACMAFSAASALPKGVMPESVGITACAADTVIYDGNAMSTFSSRSAQSVANKYSAAYYAGPSYNDDEESTYYTVPASVQKTYNQGVLTNDTLKCMQEMTSFYRWLVGCEPLSEPCKQSDSLQCQALDRNFEFDHWISNDSKPEDMPQELWDKGYECRHNILALGYTPLGAVTGWMNEGYSLSNTQWGTLGHRYALINPSYNGVQFGYSGSIAVGSCEYGSGGTMKEAFYAFPSPGYFPADCLYPSRSSWNIDFDTSRIKVTDTSAVKVTVTNLTTKLSYTCTTNDDTLCANSDSLSFVQPSDYDTKTYNYKDNYKVVITGLTDAATSKPAQVQYTVKFFDLKNYAKGRITNAGFDFLNIVIKEGTYTTADSLKKIGALLPTTVILKNEFGNTAQIKANGKWKLDEKNKCWTNSVDPSLVPEKFVDMDGCLKKLKITYSYSDDYYDQFNSLSIYPDNVSCGEKTQISVHRTHLGNECTLVALIGKDSNGNYYCKKSYSSLTSPEFDKENIGTYHYYNLTADGSDSGEYISIYYTHDDSDWIHDAYVCNSPQQLTVSHNYGEPKWTWSKDHKTCSAKFVCKGSDSYTKTVNAAITSKTTEATCTTPKKIVYTATVALDGKTYTNSTTETLKAAGHSWGKWTASDKATCTKSGTEIRKCSKCKVTEKRYVEALGHSYGAWRTSSYNVDYNTAKQTRKCTRCTKTETRTVYNAVARYAGSDRSETAALISNANKSGMYKTAGTVVIATGFDYRDALAAVPLANAYDAPLLLADRDNLSAKTLAEIRRLKAKNIIVVATTTAKDKNGYDAAIKSKVYKQLKAYNVTKLVGSSYYETAKKVAQQLRKKTGKAPGYVFFTTSKNYADALSVSPVAAALKAPILYVDPNGKLNANTTYYLKSVKSSVKKIFIIGGANAVSDGVVKMIKTVLPNKTVQRFNGADRYATCVRINNAFKSTLTGKSVCIAKGYNFPDALAGGVFAAKQKAPLFLADKLDANATISKVQSAYLKSKNPDKLYIFGGETAIPKTLLYNIANACV